MGGSGGTFSQGRSPSDIAGKLRESAVVSAAQFETELVDEFTMLLSKYNSRDSEQTAERLDSIKTALQGKLETTLDIFFGGSVAKRTYVDGISDIDSMLVLTGDLSTSDPAKALKSVSDILRNQLGQTAEVSSGNVAVTVTYSDGMEIQLVPTIKSENGLRVPAWESNTWSTINPQQFRDGLTKRNQECNNKLIPTLKLAKAVNSTLPKTLQLTGYHIESLGIAAFRNYKDEKTAVRMLPYFFHRASELVLTPMVDRTGQSVHVDEHLGLANSEARTILSHTLARIHQRMMNASAAGSRDRWRDLLGE